MAEEQVDEAGEAGRRQCRICAVVLQSAAPRMRPAASYRKKAVASVSYQVRWRTIAGLRRHSRPALAVTDAELRRIREAAAGGDPEILLCDL